MFIISLTYTKPTDFVDKYLQNHYDYIKKYMDLNKFLIVGPKVPRTGGIIICNASSVDEVKEIIKNDPFSIHDIGEFTITEFKPTKYVGILDDRI